MKTRQLKREDFEGLFEEKILERGWRYFEEDRVDDPIIADGVVRAKVHGTASYAVEVDPERMILFCSCPYFDTYGNCKHLAALLYHLADDPEVDSLDETIRILERKSKRELVTLLQRIMRAEPKLRHLLTGDLGDLDREVRGLKEGFLDADPDQFVEKERRRKGDQRNLIPFGISPNLSRNASGQFSGSKPFWARKALAHRSRPTPEQPLQRGSPDWALTLNPLGYLSPFMERF